MENRSIAINFQAELISLTFQQFYFKLSDHEIRRGLIYLSDHEIRIGLIYERMVQK